MIQRYNVDSKFTRVIEDTNTFPSTAVPGPALRLVKPRVPQPVGQGFGKLRQAFRSMASSDSSAGLLGASMDSAAWTSAAASPVPA